MLLTQHQLTQRLDLPRHLEGSDITWPKLQRSSGALFTLDIATTEPWSSVWAPPATDPLRVWPDQYSDIDNLAWASDPLGPWGGVQSFKKGIRKDTGLQPAVLNYAFMSLYDVIPCGEVKGEPRYELKNDADLIARKRNFYAALSYIHKYPTYEDMEERIGVSSFTFSRQVLPALYAMRDHAYFMDINLRFWDYNHTADFQERVLWSVDGYPVEVCASSNRFVRKLTKSGKYKTHVIKGDMMVMIGPGFPINNTFGCMHTPCLRPPAAAARRATPKQPDLNLASPPSPRRHPGTKHDSPMWMDNAARRRLLRTWEYGLGDKAYIGCPEILTEWKKPPRSSLSSAPGSEGTMATLTTTTTHATTATHANGPPAPPPAPTPTPTATAPLATARTAPSRPAPPPQDGPGRVEPAPPVLPRAKRAPHLRAQAEPRLAHAEVARQLRHAPRHR